jgi:hypothetical protein
MMVGDRTICKTNQCFKTWTRPRHRSRVNSDSDLDSGLTQTDLISMTRFTKN